MNLRHIVFAAALFGVWAGVCAQEKTVPGFNGELSLVRYDLPRGLGDGYAPTRQPAQRRDGQDAVEWPDCTLNGQPIFRGGKSVEQVSLRLRTGGEAKSPFVQEGDDLIMPGQHWLRPVQWLRGRKHLYTADKTARTGGPAEEARGRYELWLFPILLRGEGGPAIKNVVLKTGGAVVFQKNGPWRTLTLLLPANEIGKPYELSVDGRPAVIFEAGLMPVKLGNPVERVFPVNTLVPGDGPKIAVLNLPRAGDFPNKKEWDADVAALAQPLPAGGPVGEAEKAVGPLPPLFLYATALPQGMSGGFWKRGMNADDYAGQFAAAGFDAVFDQVDAFAPPGNAESIETRAVAFAKRGLRLGLQYDNTWARPSLQNPNLAFLAHTLPEWHAPLYRSLQLTAQRCARLPNFLGVNIGVNNAGYVADWPWAPPSPERPWGEGMIEFTGSPQPRVPIAPTLWPRQWSFEQPVQTEGEFTKYVERYDVSWRQYGYFGEALHDVDPRLILTTGAFGSSPAAGARGGWPWASVPGRIMHEGLKVQQVYDANQTHSAKPLHNVALIDRMRSYHPQNKTWSLLDDYKLFAGREARQRAVALVLTRGVQGIGTNFPAPGDDVAQRELNEWLHRYGSVYAMTEPEPVIGVFYSHLACVQRRMNMDEDATDEALAHGSHEGKVTEALWLCHAAGWPARVVTYQEVMRGPLPGSMKAILLVGLDQADETWSWGPGLEPALNNFRTGGGRILADDESTCPVAFTKTSLHVASYVTQSELDPTPRLLARNRTNIATLRSAMEGVPAPTAASDSPTLWAIPTRAGDTQYVTAVNWAFAEGDETKEYVRPADPRAAHPEVWKTKANASLYVAPQTGALRWETERPIYDVRLQRKVTPEEAAVCDLTKDGFRWYALPPADVVKPEVTIARGVSGVYEAHVTMDNGGEMRGVPVSVTVTPEGGDPVTVSGATGEQVALPLAAAPGRGAYRVSVTELLTGLKTETTYTPDAPSAVTQHNREEATLAKFATRKHVALVIALTAEQGKDAKIVEAAKSLAQFYEQQGRKVRIGKAGPEDVVESLQPLKAPHRFPQWKTVSSDLVLFGTPASNVLLLDQARAEIFPRNFAVPKPGAFDLVYTRSPFVGEYDAVNIVAADATGVRAAVDRLVRPGAARTASN